MNKRYRILNYTHLEAFLILAPCKPKVLQRVKGIMTFLTYLSRPVIDPILQRLLQNHEHIHHDQVKHFSSYCNFRLFFFRAGTSPHKIRIQRVFVYIICRLLTSASQPSAYLQNTVMVALKSGKYIILIQLLYLAERTQRIGVYRILLFTIASLYRS
jgi:hypothetical protein